MYPALRFFGSTSGDCKASSGNELLKGGHIVAAALALTTKENLSKARGFSSKGYIYRFSVHAVRREKQPVLYLSAAMLVTGFGRVAD